MKLSIDNLEEARIDLESNEKKLMSAMDDADIELEILRHEKALARQHILVCQRRHQKLVQLTKLLCQECWAILPALSPEAYRAAEEAQDDDDAAPDCVNCGATIIPDCESTESSPHRLTTSIKFPPKTSRLIQRSKDARQDYKDLLNGTLQSPPFVEDATPCRLHSSSFSPFYSSDEVSSYGSDCDGDNHGNTTHHCSKLESLEEVQRQKKQAKERMKQVELAIEKWTTYKEKHQVELSRVKRAIDKIKSKEICLVEARLEALGRSSSQSSSLSYRCDICLEPPEQKIAFQCGHQCCEACAESITNHCHICRNVSSDEFDCTIEKLPGCAISSF